MKFIVLHLVNSLRTCIWVCLGGIGSGINNTNELKVMGYEEVMESLDNSDWEASIDREHNQMLKSNV